MFYNKVTLVGRLTKDPQVNEYEENKKKIQEYQKQYRLEHYQEFKEYQKEFRKNNTEYQKEYYKKKKKENNNENWIWKIYWKFNWRKNK